MESWLVDIVVAFVVFLFLPRLLLLFSNNEYQARNRRLSISCSYVAVILFVLIRFVIIGRSLTLPIMLIVVVVYCLSQFLLLKLPLRYKTHSDGLTLDHEDDESALNRQAGDYHTDSLSEAQDTFSDLNPPKKKSRGNIIAFLLLTIVFLLAGTFVYIRLEAPTYSIYLDSQNGEDYEPILVSGFENYLLPTPTKEDSYFLGWFDYPVNGIQYYGHEYRFSLPKEDITLYAHWASYVHQTITTDNYWMYLNIQTNYIGLNTDNPTWQAQFTLSCKARAGVYLWFEIENVAILFKGYLYTFTTESTRTITMPYLTISRPDNLQVDGTIRFVSKNI